MFKAELRAAEVDPSFNGSDQNWWSDFDPLLLIYDATNVEMRVNFGRP